MYVLRDYEEKGYFFLMVALDIIYSNNIASRYTNENFPKKSFNFNILIMIFCVAVNGRILVALLLPKR